MQNRDSTLQTRISRPAPHPSSPLPNAVVPWGCTGATEVFDVQHRSLAVAVLMGRPLAGARGSDCFGVSAFPRFGVSLRHVFPEPALRDGAELQEPGVEVAKG
jgi:hypothetical protein